MKRVKRHTHWARTQGVGRLIEEDELDPRERIRRGRSKRKWRSQHGAPGNARAIYVVGAQRSGTNFLVRHLQQYPAVDVHNENSRAAFDRFLLRSDAEIGALVRSSPYRAVVFKPLCDSHRTDELLDDIESPADARAIWVYRSWQARALSAVAKFGSSNLNVLSAAGEDTWDTVWQLSGVSAENRSLIGSLDFTRMSPESAAALFWFIRNSLFFDHGLHERDDVLLVSYDRLTNDPVAEFAVVDVFAGLGKEEMVSTEEARSAFVPDLDNIDPVVRERCIEMQRRLDEAWVTQRQADPSVDHQGDQT